MHITKSLPTVDSVLQLEPEELAGYLLEHFGGSTSSLNPHNFGLEVDQYYKDERAKKALLGAWAWLVREGLLIASKDNWFFLSRRGLRLKGRQDLDSFRRSDILPKNSLHPVISAAVWSKFHSGEIRVKWNLPAPLAEWYSQEAPFFKDERFGWPRAISCQLSALSTGVIFITSPRFAEKLQTKNLSATDRQDTDEQN